MQLVLKKTAVLVGMMGSGKTAVGTAVAHLLGVQFLDSDAEIEIAADRTIAEIFERDGEAFFREKETQVISRLLDEECGVLSTGGGAYLSARNRQLISDKGVAVWLRVDQELLWSRVRHKNTRPLLRTKNPRETLRKLCAQREPNYALAELTVEAKRDYSVNQMADKVVAALQSWPDILKGR